MRSHADAALEAARQVALAGEAAIEPTGTPNNGDPLAAAPRRVI